MIKTNVDRQRAKNSRDGTVYVAVLGVALIIGVIGISSIHVARLELAEACIIDEMARARLAAQSGMECVLAKIKSDPQWRTTYSAGITTSLSTLSNNLTTGDSFEFSLIDPDGNLGDNADDSVTIRCVGKAGNARHVAEVLLQPAGEGLTSLAASIHSHREIVLDNVLTTNQVVSSNYYIDATDSSAAIVGNAQAATLVLGTVSGNKTHWMSPQLEMPDQTTVFEYYVANGTTIRYSELAAGGRIQRVLLSSGSNPYGLGITNPQGIYVINCQGNNITISESRILATLVFLNAGTVQVDDRIHWQAAIPNFPTVMVQGRLRMNWSTQHSLSESTVGVNFNPTSTPYQGSSDNDFGDTYPGQLNGLIYVTGKLSVDRPGSINGVVVAQDDVRIDNTLTLTYDSKFVTDAPPGFTAGTEMEIVPGTWKHVAY